MNNGFLGIRWRKWKELLEMWQRMRRRYGVWKWSGARW